MGDSCLELKVENDLVLREFSFEDVDTVVSLIENNKHYLFPYDSDVLSDTRDIHVDYLHRIIAESKNNTKKGFGIWLNAEHIII